MTAGEPLTGRATPEGTRKRAQSSTMGEGFYREIRGLTLSTVGMGSYLGETDDQAREAYRRSAQRALEQGVTLLDTASNYRHQASERDLGAALEAVGDREGVFVSTKGGFLHGDVDQDGSMQGFIQETYIEPGILEPADVVGGQHAMTPAFLRTEVDRSLENLGLETVDLYLVHNPETQLAAGITREAFHERLLEAFTELERQRADGKIGGYGVATWDGLRVGPDDRQHLSLQRLLELAETAHEAVGAGDEHGFSGIQLPFNLAMPEAATAPSQDWDGEQVPVLEAAADAGLIVLCSASLMQARLLGNVTADVREAFDAGSDLTAALDFARSARGVTTALVGMGTPDHVDENLEAVRGRPPAPESVDRLL